MPIAKFDFDNMDLDNYFFIAHLFDRVLIGEENKRSFEELVEGIRRNAILEAHFFNTTKEIFVTRVNDELASYEPLLHEPEYGKDVVSRIYKLDKEVVNHDGEILYDSLETKEYIAYDSESHLAYVEKTVLYKLSKGGGRDGKR